MDEHMKISIGHFFDFGAIGAALYSFAGLLMDIMPHVTAGISSVLSLVYLFFRLKGVLMEQGYIQGRVKRTRKEDHE